MTWKVEKKWQAQSDLINVDKDIMNSGVEDFDTAKFKQQSIKTLEVIKDLKEFNLPKKNETLKFVTFKSFNAAVFLSEISKVEKVKRLIIAAYSVNYESAQVIDNITKQKDFEKCTLLISNLRNKAHRAKEQLTRDMFVENHKIDLFFASSHAKIMAIKTEKNYYVLEGSGNLSFNSRVEQYTLDNCIKVYQFTEKWFNELKTFLEGKKELVIT